MFTKKQELLLEKFAEKSDQLFELGITSTDSFTGEIGEYIVCRHFNLKKSNRVAQAVDGVSVTGERFQIKAKVISNNNFSYNFKDLEQNLFDTLAIVYFDRLYTPLKIVIIPSRKIKNGTLNITNSIVSNYQQIEGAKIKVPSKAKKAINEFALVYNSLEEANIIRSRRIVGDIGEFYACKKLNLKLSENKNEKGIDARHDNGLTFEIKTRRVYESERRVSETRRLNNLVGKTADYLVVVTLDRSFKCSGMWLIPISNIINPKSANLKVVNSTPGTLNLIPSQISWLHSGETFKGFGVKKVLTRPVKSIIVAKTTINKNEKLKNKPTKTAIKPNKNVQLPQANINNDIDGQGSFSFFDWVIIILVLLFLIAYLTDEK